MPLLLCLSASQFQTPQTHKHSITDLSQLIHTQVHQNDVRPVNVNQIKPSANVKQTITHATIEIFNINCPSDISQSCKNSIRQTQCFIR